MSQLVKESQLKILNANRLNEKVNPGVERVLGNRLKAYAVFFPGSNGGGPSYEIRFSFGICKPFDLYYIVDSTIRDGYRYVETDMEMPNGFYQKISEGISPVYRVLSESFHRRSTLEAAEEFDMRNPPFSGMRATMYYDTTNNGSEVDFDGRRFGIHTSSLIDQTIITGSFKSQDDMRILNRTLKNSKLKEFLRVSISKDFPYKEFDKLIDEITAW